MSETILQRLETGTASAPELAVLTGLSQPTLSRRLAALRTQVLPLGAPRFRRYGLLRAVRDLSPEVPVYRINEQGSSRKIGTLFTLAAGECWFESSGGQSAASRLYPDLPWWVQDLRPQGFLGRQFPREFPEMGLPLDIRQWDAATTLYALTRRGWDLPGDLLLGEVAFSHWWEQQRRGTQSFDAHESQIEQDYAERADAVQQGAMVGSSAAGEQPKFVSRVLSGDGAVRPVIVKFSPPRTEAIGTRWSDLLIAEHLALTALRGAGIAVAASRIVQSPRRTFLEVTRFDRLGAAGRRSVVSIGAADNEFTGIGGPWPAIARALVIQQRLAAADAECIERIAAFGHLIANTDMHPGNLGLHHDTAAREGYGQFTLAPVYDMLPMRYAPVGGEVITPVFTVPAPVGGLIDAYAAMRPAALGFWQTVAAEPRISDAFRATAAANARVLAAL